MSICFLFSFTGMYAQSQYGKYIEFAQMITKAASSGDADILRTSIDVDALVRRTIGDKARNSEMYRQARESIAALLPEVTHNMINGIDDAGSWKFLRLRTMYDHVAAIIRMQAEFGPARYLALLVGDGANGKVVVVDWVAFEPGLALSDILRFRLIAKGVQSAALCAMAAGGEEDGEAIEALDRYIGVVQNGSIKELNAAFNVLPDRIKRIPETLLYQAWAANRYGDDERQRALQFGEDILSADSALGLLLSDWYIYTGDVDQAQLALQRFDAFIGGDAALWDYAAGIYFAAGNPADALQAAEKAVTIDTMYERAYWRLLDLYIRGKRFSDAVAMLDSLEHLFEYELDAEVLTAQKGYATFMLSDEFMAWKRRHDK